MQQLSRWPTRFASPQRLEIQPGVWLDARLALWLAAPRLLVVADLHWGYAVSHQARGNLLPSWGDEEIARRLNSLVADYQPLELLWLGDSLHTLDGRGSAENFLRSSSVPIAIVSGNHDASWSRPKEISVVQRGRFCLHHGDRDQVVPPDALEIIGHHHPTLSWHDGAGARLKLPALVASDRRLILPAFSPWAAGTPWKRGQEGETIYAVGAKRIFTVASGLHPIACPAE